MNEAKYLIEAFKAIDNLHKTMPPNIDPEPVCYGYVSTKDDILYSLEDEFSLYTVYRYIYSKGKIFKLMTVDSINKISMMCEKHCK